MRTEAVSTNDGKKILLAIGDDGQILEWYPLEGFESVLPRWRSIRETVEELLHNAWELTALRVRGGD